MATRTLVFRASQVIAAAGVAVALGAPVPAAAQYAVSDSQLTGAVSQAIQKDQAIAVLGIQVSASQGVVTLNGSVPNEQDRIDAEQVAGGVDGVRSIQDNLKVSGGSAAPPPASAQNEAPPPPQAQAQSAPENIMPPPPPTDNASPSPAQGEPQSYPPPQSRYEQPGGWGPRGAAHPPAGYNALGVSPQRQNASGPVTIPAGSLISVRTSQPLSTGSLQDGEVFQATAAADIYENGVVAVPRGAIFTGVVVQAKNAGAFGGRPKLDLRLTSIQLGPSTYPVTSQVWSSAGPSKSGYTAANTAGGAIVGALIGGLAGGGVGAGVGAIAGGAGGAVVSGATHGPRLDLPPEALLEFQLAQPLTVQPVRFEEAQRLVNSAPPPPRLVRRPVYPPYPPPPYPPPPYPPPYPYPY